MNTSSKILKTELLITFDASDGHNYALLAELIDSPDDDEWLIHVVAKGPTKTHSVSIRPFGKDSTTLEGAGVHLESMKARPAVLALVEEAKIFMLG